MEKKIIYFVSLFVLIAILLITGCVQKIPQEQSTGQTPSTTSQQLIIKTGTSFGMCAGYCKEEITITSKKIVFHKSGWEEDLYPEITEEVPISNEQWTTLSGYVDFEKFNSLNDTIGCPDCADGGAEWIEIDNGKSIKKVTFEYGVSIAEIDNLILEHRFSSSVYVS
jgi:hypothetical protein